jgi:hypothetical protein
MLTRRTLLLFIFGMTLIFLAIGIVSEYASSLEQPAQQQGAQRLFEPARVQAIRDDADIERVRGHALYYLELARDMQARKHDAQDLRYYDVRMVAFLASGLFLAVALMIALWRPAAAGKDANKAAGTAPAKDENSVEGQAREPFSPPRP